MRLPLSALLWYEMWDVAPPDAAQLDASFGACCCVLRFW